jgi:hypothetical protein
VAPHNIECYKCHNYGHMAHDCRSMIDTSMIENNDIRYKKVWKRKQEQVTKDQVPEITGFAVVREEEVQEIVLLGILVRDQSTNKHEEV